MTVHLIKLCVGIAEVEELAAWQARRRKQSKGVWHVTRMVPTRAAELVDGGSMYWVIRGSVLVRQRIEAVERYTDEEGIGRCKLVFDPELVPVRPVPRRAFQGWRYLSEADAPPDLPPSPAGDELPPKLRAELAALGLL
ncbi:MAG TPA: DUF1489 domain-containing protein [Aestuariivirgaceae bacterium]|nr:DUF1489 domain-containing protein [Aestuariivirgaceae bacterium]